MPAVVLRAERPHLGTRWVESGRVLVRRRIQTRVVPVEVTVRQEVLEIRELPGGPSSDDGGSVRTGAGIETATDTATDTAPAVSGSIRPVAEFVLREEVPVVTVEVRPTERVRLGVRAVAGEAAVEVATRHEEVSVEATGVGRRSG